MDDRSRLEIVENLARQAGKIALDMRPTISVSLKDDGSFITEADLAVQEFLFKELRALFPDCLLVGEESCCENNAFPSDRPAFVIDPIDGTDAYRSGLAYFCVSIGLYEKGRLPLGVVYLPVFDDIYSVDAGVEAKKNGRPIRVCADCVLTENSFLAAPSNFHRHFTTDFPGKVRSLGSTAFHLALVAAGGAVAASTSGFLWDVAAGIALVEAAGGKVALLDGRPVDWGRHLNGARLPAELLAAPVGLFDEIAATIKRKEV